MATVRTHLGVFQFARGADNRPITVASSDNAAVVRNYGQLEQRVHLACAAQPLYAKLLSV